MSTMDNQPRGDERSQQLARLDGLLHACGAALLLLGAAIYCFAFHAPISASERALAKRVDTLTRVLDKAGGLRDELAETETQLDELRRRAADVRERIPDDDSASEYLRSLSEVAADNGIVIVNFRRLESQHNRSFSQTDIHVTCEGTYESICHFLDGLERLPRLARVIKLKITADEPVTARYPLEMDIRLYYGLRRSARLPKTTQRLPTRYRDGPPSRLLAYRPRGTEWEGGAYG